MRDHLKILGWIYIVSGSFVLLLAVLFGAIFGFAGLFGAHGQDAAVLGGIGALVMAFMTVLSLPAIFLGWGLLTYRPWSRILGIVLSVLHLPSFPVGTMIGAYGLWVLTQEESRRLLESGDPRVRIGGGW
jgi:hypothetical protein